MRLTTLTVLFSICALASPAWTQVVSMSNDECSTNLQIVAGVNPSFPAASGHLFTNAGSTPSGVNSNFCNQSVPDVWFGYIANTTGSTTISTCTPSGFAPGSLVDTYMAVQMAGCVTPTILACNDDFCGSLSSVTFTATSGQTYYVRIGGMNGSVGTFYVTVTPPPPPPNDECSGAIPLTLGSNGPFSNATATNSSGAAASCGFAGSPGHRDLWFSLTACGAITIDTCNGAAGFDTILQVYDACGGVELACNDDTGGACNLGSTVSVTTTIPTSYIIRVSAYGSVGTGSFPIHVTVPSSPAALVLTSPLGPGSAQADLLGPKNGTYFVAATFAGGVFPNGWLFGLDISYADLANELASGFPYLGPLDACGKFTIGPVQGMPPGLTIYAVAFGFPPGASTPSSHSATTSYTIP